ncbi:proteasome maturation factor UMP1 [Acaromyces ingoldii]|uniref:Proteasome maturation factor UMP1 n=1 Tax=Acaromyces ingoldii TaxID=215250 RepID=A0A316YYC7_9BASI|nr:proteasome maturation factor UMP1 [Acaromyces ingoldii]PWN93093.1 proteasome maturation factor UMP1 [Acaromyces ingoldii]
MSSSSQKEAMPGPSLRIVPGPPSQNSVTLNATEHHVHKGVHDTMRFGPRSLAHETSASATQHPLQHRLEQWDETRDNLKLTTMRNIYGVGAPIRTLMERRIVGHNPHFPALHSTHVGGPRKGLSGLHLDILSGNDETIDPADFLPSDASGGDLHDIHSHMERKHRI